ncbi:MAG: DNA phosphorothioation-associated protein 4 [Oleiphilus sp.]|nr:MAG: DNA phosphorothioation-associated protein 4 [Oleiphilus sp.]
MFSGNDKHDGWKKLAVKRDRAYEPLIDLLVNEKNHGRSVFSYNKDLMVFAAMVGHSLSKRKPLSDDTVSIILETYATDQKDALIYLIALMEERDGIILKDENLPKAIRIFEEYCNAGLEEIKLWIDENPKDPTGVETLLEKTWERVQRNESEGNEEAMPEEVEVDF